MKNRTIENGCAFPLAQNRSYPGPPGRWTFFFLSVPTSALQNVVSISYMSVVLVFDVLNEFDPWSLRFPTLGFIFMQRSLVLRVHLAKSVWRGLRRRASLISCCCDLPPVFIFPSVVFLCVTVWVREPWRKPTVALFWERVACPTVRQYVRCLGELTSGIAADRGRCMHFTVMSRHKPRTTLENVKSWPKVGKLFL